jgi:hypothetical protein
MSDNFKTAFVFPATVATANDVTTITDKLSVTAPTRSSELFCPALSTVCVHITGTATVKVISNPFGDAAKDLVLSTISTAGATNYVIASAINLIVDVTAVTGTVSVKVVYNSEVD